MEMSGEVLLGIHLSSSKIEMVDFWLFRLKTSSSAFYDFVQMSVQHVQMRVHTLRLAHGPFQFAVQ